MIMGAFNLKNIDVRVYVIYKRVGSQSGNKYVCYFIETAFEERVKKLRPLARLFHVAMKYVISVDGKPAPFPGYRLWVFFQK